MFDTDVFVVGGGPAGLAAAIAARHAGLRALIADGAQPAIDKACGEGLMPESLQALQCLGIFIPDTEGFRLRGIRYTGGNHSVSADFPHGSGLGLRRTALHTLLVQHALSAGVEIRWATPVTGLEGDVVCAGGKRFRARWIVGADGAQSRVRRWAGLHRTRRDSRRFSYRKHFRMQPWSDLVEVHWATDCQMYVTPVSPDKICLVLMARDPRQRIADALPKFPALAERLSSNVQAGSERGAIAATRVLRRIANKNVALIGDASGTVDPITGEGLCLAFRQAVALANAFTTGDLSAYEHAHRALARRPRFMADFMMLMDRSDALRRRAMAVFEAHPHLFANILAMHVGHFTATRFAAAAAVLGMNRGHRLPNTVRRS